MNSECSHFQQQIPQSFLGDLSLQDRESLDRHLDACNPCHEEHKRYAETLSLLQASGDEPVPRHFFVYPQERAVNPWQLFCQWLPRWQVATLGFAAVVFMMAAATFGGMQIRSDQGSWTVSFGRTNTSAGVDLTALKAEILQAADQRNRDAARIWIQNLREQIGSGSYLSEEQQIQALTALTSLETRLNQRISDTADEIRTGTDKSNVVLYQTISDQREQDMNRVNARLDRVIEANELRAQQTNEILETLFQIVSNLQQPGEPK